MSFARPEWLFALLALPVVAAFARAWSRSRRRAAESFGGVRAGSITASVDPGMRLVVAAALLVIAVAGPRVGVAPRPASTAGLDVVVALDVSRSMWVEDVGESRLERARREIRAFVSRIAAGRVALIGFAGEAEILCPKTADRLGFESRLDDAGPASRTGAGSSLIAGLEAALASFAPDDGRDHVVLIVSDGEARDDSEAWQETVARTRRDGVVVHALVVGSRSGGPVPEGAASSDRFLEGADGPVISRADRSRLAEIVAATGGTLHEDGDDPSRLAVLADSLALFAETAEGRLVLAPVDRYRWPLFFALLILWPRGALERRGVLASRTPASVRFAGVPLLLAFVGTTEVWRSALEAHDRGDLDTAITRYREAIALAARDGDATEPIEFDLAIALLRRGDHGPAATEFERLAAAPELSARARQGAGLAAALAAEARRGTEHERPLLQRARGSFLEALRAGAGDAAAANLEHVTRRLAELDSAGSSGTPSAGADADGDRGDRSDPQRSGADRSGAERSGADSKAPAESTPPRPAKGEGPVSGEAGTEAAEPEPPGEAARRMRHDEIAAIVAEFERRRIEYDRARANRGRALEPFDW